MPSSAALPLYGATVLLLYGSHTLPLRRHPHNNRPHIATAFHEECELRRILAEPEANSLHPSKVEAARSIRPMKRSDDGDKASES